MRTKPQAEPQKYSRQYFADLEEQIAQHEQRARELREQFANDRNMAKARIQSYICPSCGRSLGMLTPIDSFPREGIWSIEQDCVPDCDHHIRVEVRHSPLEYSLDVNSYDIRTIDMGRIYRLRGKNFQISDAEVAVIVEAMSRGMKPNGYYIKQN